MNAMPIFIASEVVLVIVFVAFILTNLKNGTQTNKAVEEDIQKIKDQIDPN